MGKVTELKSLVEETKLLASAPDMEGIKKMIARYWYAKPEDIKLSGDEEKGWSVANGDKTIPNVRVVKKGNRLRFERQVEK